MEDDGAGTTKRDALGGDLMCTLMAALHFPVREAEETMLFPAHLLFSVNTELTCTGSYLMTFHGLVVFLVNMPWDSMCMLDLSEQGVDAIVYLSQRNFSLLYPAYNLLIVYLQHSVGEDSLAEEPETRCQVGRSLRHCLLMCAGTRCRSCPSRRRARWACTATCL